MNTAKPLSYVAMEGSFEKFTMAANNLTNQPTRTAGTIHLWRSTRTRDEDSGTHSAAMVHLVKIQMATRGKLFTS